MSGKVARRYARALFEATNPDAVELIRAVLNAVSVEFEESQVLREAVSNPAIPVTERKNRIADIVRAVPGNLDTLVRLLEQLVDNARVGVIKEIAQQFSVIVDNFIKVRSIEVTSAFELANEEKEQFVADAKKELGSGARVSWHVDSDLIGGLRVRAGDLLLDGSMRSVLERLKGVVLA